LVKVIAIVGTGSCVYRGVVASEEPDLLAANRTAGHEAGKLTDEGLDQREIALALKLRQDAAALGRKLFIDGKISHQQIVASNKPRPGFL
jgi:cytochrome c peroxidase